MKIQKEDKLIIDILFKSGLNNKLLFNQVDYSILTKKLSEHLIIPAFYYNLKKKNYLKYFDPDFTNYLSQIYSLNKTRNRKIIKEISKISLILESKHIEYIFIKGASNFIAELYSDIGERMITDIDILVKERTDIDLRKTELSITDFRSRILWHLKFLIDFVTRNKSAFQDILVNWKLQDYGNSKGYID